MLISLKASEAGTTGYLFIIGMIQGQELWGNITPYTAEIPNNLVYIENNIVVGYKIKSRKKVGGE